MSLPSVSIAMATFNGAPFVAEQLDSIVNQTVAPMELVICDDGSTDATLLIAREFAKRSNFQVTVHGNQRRLGYIHNFRKAASLCSGELIAFCDQDDRWLPERLEICAGHFRDPELQLLYHNAWLIDENRHRLGLLYDAERERCALNLSPIGPWNQSFGLVQIFRADLREFDDFWEGSISHVSDPLDILAHDQWYFFLAQAIGKVSFLDEPLLEYRQHNSNLFGAACMRPAVENRLLRRLTHNGSQDLRLAKAASARSLILRNLASRLPDSAPRLRLIADHYEKLAQRLGRRFGTYCSAKAGARLGSLIGSWRAGDYCEWPWGFNRWSVFRDLWSGVVLAKSSSE